MLNIDKPQKSSIPKKLQGTNHKNQELVNDF
jgi:hypothetical protein